MLPCSRLPQTGGTVGGRPVGVSGQRPPGSCISAAPQGASLWKVGLTDVTFLQLLAILPTCIALRMLVLESNPLPERSFYKLISEETTLAHLLLRNNDIDDEAALLIAQALSTLKSTNRNLVSINLSYNHITDEGAGHIANVLGPFALTHTEVVERRRLLLEKDSQERCRMPQRQSEPKSERPASHVSNTAIDKLQLSKPVKATKATKKELLKKEEKGQAGGGAAAQTTPAPLAKKEDTKQVKKGAAAPAPDQKQVRGKGAKSGTKDKRAQVVEVEVAETTEMMNPLLEAAEHKDGKVFLPGNRILIYLNLIWNQITETGLKAFLTVVEQQMARMPLGGKGATGRLRLCLAKNNFPSDSKVFARIQELMVARDPLPKTGASAKMGEDEQVGMA